MTSSSQQVTDDIWAGDLLGRRADAELLQQFLTRRVAELRARGATACYTLNIDARWGQGKSYFLERFGKHLEGEGYRVASINAWAEDYVEDPFIGVMAEILKAFGGEKSAAAKKTMTAMAAATGKVLGVVGKHAAKGVLKKAFGVDGAEMAAEVGAEAAKAGTDTLAELSDAASAKLADTLVKQFEESRQTIAHFKKALAKLIAGSGRQPLFVLIDELDRCRPTHAVAILERLKHLFDVDGLVFVLATDTDQLRHAINAVYGASFDSRGYLLRFFDRTYRFPEPDRQAYVAHLFKQHAIDTSKLRSPPDDNGHVRFFTQVVDTFDLPLREIERCCDMLETVITLWDKPFGIQMTFMLPLIVAAMKPDPEFFAELARTTHLSKDYADRFKRTIYITFPAFHDYHAKVEAQAFTVQQLLETALSGRGALLRDHMSRRGDTPHDTWWWTCFKEEFHNAHGNQSFGDGPISFIHQYPRLVGRVGRLSPPPAPDDYLAT